MKRSILFLALAALLCSRPGGARQAGARDVFFWLGEINKATAVINTDEGLLDRKEAPRLAAAVAKVIQDGNQPGGKRPSLVVTFEPLLIQAGGPERSRCSMPAAPARTCSPRAGPPSCATACWTWPDS